MSQEIKNLCMKLTQSTSSQEVAKILLFQPLIIRTYFALLSGCVPSSSDRYSLAKKILKATRCRASGKSIVSWNVNSLRSNIIDKKPSRCKSSRVILPSSPMGKLIATTNPDIICLQETKLNPENISCFNIVGFYTYWNCSTARKGYSGVSIWSREKPLSVSTELPGAPTELENEGRILTAYYPGYAVVNTYTPNTLRASDKPVEGWDSVKNGNERKDTYDYYIGMRMAWDKALSKHLERLKEEVGDVIWCGDLNVARSLNDIHNGKMTKDKINSEKANRNRASRIKELEKRYSKAEEVLQYGTIAGLRHEEREGLDKVLSNGFSDAYRELYPEKYGFTYWDTTKKSFRSSNNGWRIDYFIISNNLLSCVQSK
jgi:exodeoxyribonuclease-3